MQAIFIIVQRLTFSVHLCILSILIFSLHDDQILSLSQSLSLFLISLKSLFQWVCYASPNLQRDNCRSKLCGKKKLMHLFCHLQILTLKSLSWSKSHKIFSNGSVTGIFLKKPSYVHDRSLLMLNAAGRPCSFGRRKEMDPVFVGGGLRKAFSGGPLPSSVSSHGLIRQQ